MPFEFQPLNIEGLLLIKTKKFEDPRGFFCELYKEEDFKAAGIPPIKQINFSSSSNAVLRGLHYQLPPFAQGKVVRVVEGEIYDVAVDLRASSKTFGQYFGIKLNAKDPLMFYIPEGFAHGFEVLSATARFEYFCTQVYSPANEGGIIYNDQSINIPWNTKSPILSQKDLVHPPFSKTQKYF
jgi:dTDP-4-dehydrorhamnose 3,5-epimerase